MRITLKKQIAKGLAKGTKPSGAKEIGTEKQSKV